MTTKQSPKEIAYVFSKTSTIREGARLLDMSHETYRRRLIEMNLHKAKKKPRLNAISWQAVMDSITYNIPISPLYILYKLRTQFKQLNTASASLGISVGRLSLLYKQYGKSWKGFELTNEEKKVVDRTIRRIHKESGDS